MLKIDYDKSKFKRELEILSHYDLKLPYINNPDKLSVNIISEVHNSLITEGEFSSRRELKEAFKNKGKGVVTDGHYENYIQGYFFVNGQKDIKVNDIYALYAILTKNIDLGKENLDPGSMFRKGDVTIGSANYNDLSYYGADPKNIVSELQQIIDYIKSGKEDSIIIKCIVAHFLFELTHPFYDYNGRTGRLLPMWIMAIEGTYHNCLRYFSTSVGTFRDQYLKSFAKSVKKQSSDKKYNRSYDINIFIKKTLRLLIMNQYQYDFVNNIENELNKNGITLTSLEKNVIMSLIKKYEIQSSSNTFVKSKPLHDDVDTVMKQPQFSKLIDTLVKKKLIKKILDKHMKVCLVPTYTLFEDSDKKLA